MIGTFIQPIYGNTVASLSFFIMHSIGLLVALPLAALFGQKLAPHFPKTQFFIELSPLCMPSIRNMFIQAFQATKKFIKEAGTIIFALSILIWALSYFPVNQKEDKIILNNSNIEKEIITEETSTNKFADSYLARIGKSISPVFEPLGFNWEITVSILSAFLAREVAVSALGILYPQDPTKKNSRLETRLANATRENGQPVFTPLVAISLMVFFAFCSQCISTLAIMYRELNSVKWPIVTFCYMTLLAYIASLSVFQIGKLLGLS